MLQKHLLSLFALFIFTIQVYSQNTIVLETDYTNNTTEKQNIKHHLNVFNRINPINGFRSPATENASLCVVRPLGGLTKDGKADLSRDTFKWDGEKFVTDFSLLKTQIDRIYNQGYGLHQIVLDNPSWAFQRNKQGVLIGGEYKTQTYGNAEPPVDFDMWAGYLRDVMQFLVETYGEERMLKVQFGIGREMGTQGHWTGTQELFFDFYHRSYLAIQSVLPDALIGTHFLWETSNHPWGSDFVRWAKENNVPYDFVGVSYYPPYDRARRTNFKEVYTKDFGPIKDIPEWNPDAKLQIHEFALTSTFGGNTYTEAPREYQNSFLMGMMKMFYENDMDNLNLWGSGAQYFPATQTLLDIEGQSYHNSSKAGSHNSEDNYVDAIFTSDKSNNEYNIIAYSYNANPSSNISENLNFNATIGVPSGTEYRYRLAIYDKENEIFPWSDWTNAATTNGNSNNKSLISLNAILPVFSFLRYEIEILEIPSNVAPSIQFTEPTGGLTLEEGYSSFMLNAEAYDTDGGISGVALYIDDLLIRNDVTTPYEWGSGDNMNETLGLGPGTYNFRAVATDDDGATNQDTFLLTVTGFSNELPTVQFIQPSGNLTLEEGYTSFMVTAEASDTDGNIFSVDLYIDDVLIRNDVTTPYEWGSGDNTGETVGLAPGIHTFKLVATDNKGAITQDTIEVSVEPTSLTFVEKLERIRIFPNPTKGEFFIDGIPEEQGIVTIRDMSGKVVFNAILKTENQTFDISNLTSSMYMITLTYDKADVSKKLLKE
ncbi:MAG: Ig-like domain-containing protein [Maribacter sp.]